MLCIMHTYIGLDEWGGVHPPFSTGVPGRTIQLMKKKFALKCPGGIFRHTLKRFFSYNFSFAFYSKKSLKGGCTPPPLRHLPLI